MKKAKFDITSLIVIIIIIALLSPLGVFLDQSLKQNEAKSNPLSGIPQFLAKYTPLEAKKFFGFGLVEGWWDAFARAIIAMLILWLVYKIIQFLRFLRSKDINSKDYEELNESQTKWFNVIAGSAWKIPVVAFFFATFMQIPIINRIFYFILFDFFWDYTSLFAKALSLAFVLGFLPALIENAWKEIYKNKLQKKVWDAEKVGAITKVQAKMISEGIK